MSQNHKTSWAEFATRVTRADLKAISCGSNAGEFDTRSTHWQIKGGKRLVNCWPSTKKGFRLQVDGEKSRDGSIAEAIELAGPPKAPKPQVEREYPASHPDNPPWKDRPVGLIRRAWQWIW
ncbi:hypothetical protein LCGC14_1042560 [marine sediment metagenome]|uniref:Uncharacterized protein n=1 Tax=marine sediment metagenome TaxID=412755 RepID=A0A0F9QXL3_9ZZZZ